jgi:hypothetical protein
VPSTGVTSVKFVTVPEALVSTKADGVPKSGVTRVGLVANTKAPEPVSSVTAAARFALDGVPRNVATPEPKEVMPVPPCPGDKGVVNPDRLVMFELAPAVA